ncbi:hypothetical protein POPTR_018G146800v4 [Populus trichocarpa]|uniref:FLZ-type domain-containing protein n=1 Tax=Populus trichocarpa TaxID=3694 RepID=U5FID2_POPTR|nr:FCS-Like Zinc finger 14 [Populus trichocarpa]PNS94435.1 hypothetical protein POPTR_018G146800v4 [Populus trichocarpa]|eukprot:XP_006388240.2 uncharacterized protein LOC18109942 [Populus trichocarpa]
MSQFGLKMEKKRPRISLSLFTTLTETFSMANKSPRNFKNGGSAVGLGIVAAMDESDKVSDFALSPRSSPVPVVSLKKPASCFKEGGIGVWNFDKGGVVVDENDESYTCVISHVGNNVIKKSVYYDDKVCVDSVSWFDVGSGLLYAASPAVMMPIDVATAERREFWSKDFLSSCHLCKKLLEGLDIFMYRGENAFCSPECRDKHIRIEDFKEKSGSEARKKQECSVTPCSSPLLFFAGVAAA